MQSPRHRRLLGSLAGLAAGALALAGLTTTLPAHAAVTAADRAPAPSAKAQQQGVTRGGGGFMGWEVSGPAAASPNLVAQPAASVSGIDVSRYQGNVDWASYWSEGKRFAYIKATEGTYNTNAYFTQQYNGSYNQGFIRGAYHFANPSDSGGKAQADFFVAHGGGWSGDGKTLPGVLDIEYNPYDGGTCYGLSKASMVSWITAFVNEYKTKTGRDAVIYTTTDWWTTCTGNSTKFHTTNPLWVARYASAPGTLPGSWPYYTFWQYTSSPLDQDYFNGTLDRLKVLATG